MSKKLIHTYPVSHFANQVKVDKLLSLYSMYALEFRKLLHSQYRLCLRGDVTALSSLGSTKGATTSLSQCYYQACKARACEALSSYVTHLHERALRILANSSVRESSHSLYRQTLYLLKCQSRLIRYHIPMQLHLPDNYGTEVSVPNVQGKQELISREARTLYERFIQGIDKPSKQAILAMLKANFQQKLAGNIGDGVIAIPRLIKLASKAKSWYSNKADRVQLAEHLKGLTDRRGSPPLFQLGLTGDAQSDFQM